MDGTHRDTLLTLLRAGLLLVGLLVPLNAPFSIPPVGDETFFGWDSGPAVREGRVRRVVTHAMRHAYTRGLRPGDIVLRIDGAEADAAAIERTRREAAPGDTIELKVLRGTETQVIRLPVVSNSASYSGYFIYRLAVALLGWLVGMALIAWRGSQPPGLLLGAALLLLTPITLPSGVPAQGPVLHAAQVAWQLQAAAQRFLFPALLFHFLALYGRRPALLRAPAFWWAVYALSAVTLGLVTDAFRAPMAWGPIGPARQLRTLVGFVFELLALAAAISLHARRSELPRLVRWMASAILVLTASSALRSFVVVARGEAGVHEFIWRLEGLAFILLPAAGVLYLAERSSVAIGDWYRRRRLASSVSVILTTLYGVAVAGTAAVVLSSLGRSLGGAEWLLFGTIFLSSISFSPVLRWGRELVDRRMFARWAELESQAHGFVDRISAELRPDRIGRRVARELPDLLDVPYATLVIARELVEAWALEDAPGLEVRPRDSILAGPRGAPSHHGDVVVPILRPDGELMGALRLGRREGERPFEPPERAVLRTLAQGVASALRNAETYLALHRAQKELAENERIAAMGALAGGLAHEIKNPLAGLKMGLHLLGRDGPSTERVQRIARDVRRIDDLVSGLLRFTHEGVPESAEPVEVQQVARDCVDEFRAVAEDRGARLDEDYPSTACFVIGGRNQLRLIISNLLSNAVGASGDGAAVRIEVRALPRTVEILVHDEGPGLPEGAAERVFDLNFSGRPGGSGLGLALARRETERMGGTIEAVAGEERGATLRVALPRVKL